MPIPRPANASLNEIPVYQPGRPIEEVARHLGFAPSSIIKLASNENPLGPSPKAVAAMQRALANVHLYPDGNAFYLKEALARKLGVQPANLILGNGSNEVIEFVGHAYLAPGVDVVVSQYCFAVYPLITKVFGANVVTVPARDYGHDLPAMLAAITPATRAVFVANPNNPTGTHASAEALRLFVESVPDRVLIALDEAYIEFLEPAKRADFIADILSGKRQNLILMRTFSKIYGLAGLRLGYGIAHPDLIAALEKIREPFNINSIAQAGAIAALDDDEHTRRTRENNAVGLRFVEKACHAMNLDTIPSVANCLLVRVGSGQRIFDALQHEGVITRPMGGYQLPEWIRISIGTPAENERCMVALKKVLAASASSK
jgi:histidinol-phosphate aminotransferase